MRKHFWDWVSYKEITYLLEIREAKEEEVIVLSELFYSANINVKAAINPNFFVEDEKVIIMLSYRDIKRVFESTLHLTDYFKYHYYRRNTSKSIGANKADKIRTRFFVVPRHYLKGYMKLLDRITDPIYGITDLNATIDTIKYMYSKKKGLTAEDRTRETIESIRKAKDRNIKEYREKKYP